MDIACANFDAHNRVKYSYASIIKMERYIMCDEKQDGLLFFSDSWEDIKHISSNSDIQKLKALV